MKKFLLLFILLSIFISHLYAQHKTIKGKVIDELFETLPYVSITINDTVKVGKTDLNGFFKIDIPVSEKKISFSSVGYEQANLVLANNCDEIELIMPARATYDFITLKKADKLRMKRLKQMPGLHKQAFEKGIFKRDSACYTQEFIPYYNKKRK